MARDVSSEGRVHDSDAPSNGPDLDAVRSKSGADNSVSTSFPCPDARSKDRGGMRLSDHATAGVGWSNWRLRPACFIRPSYEQWPTLHIPSACWCVDIA